LAEPWYPTACADAVRDQILSGYIGPGETTEAFARAVASYLGIAHVLPTVSGTAALSVAAHALGLIPGDEILLPAYGVISTINAFASIGLAPRLVDINPTTGCMAPTALKRAIGPNTRAVCYVDFSGRLDRDLVEITTLCRDRGLPLIEDSACALGHRHDGRSAASFGDIGILSFSVPKVVSTGQGGALATARTDLFDRARAFIDHGDLEWRATNLNRGIGTNLRFNDILASFGLCQIVDIEDRLARRRASYAGLSAELGDRLYAVPGGEAPLHNIIFTTEPRAMVDTLRKSGIGAAIQYRTLSQHPAYATLADQVYPNADWWTEHAVYLPLAWLWSLQKPATSGIRFLPPESLWSRRRSTNERREVAAAFGMRQTVYSRLYACRSGGFSAHRSPSGHSVARQFPR